MFFPYNNQYMLIQETYKMIQLKMECFVKCLLQYTYSLAYEPELECF